MSELAYAESTSDFSTNSASLVDVTGITISPTVGSRPIYVHVQGLVWTLGAATITFNLVEDPAGANTSYDFGIQTLAATSFEMIHMIKRLTPSAGAHVYKLQMKMSASTGHCDGSNADDGGPFKIWAEDV